MKRWLLLVVVVLLIVGGLGGFKAFQISKAIAFANSFPEQTETVKSWQVFAVEWQPKASVVGTVMAPESVWLRNEYAGEIREVGYQPGDLVEQGQMLIALDTREERARLAAAQARGRLAQLQLRRFADLASSKSASEGQVDEARANLAVANAEAAQLQAVIDKKTLTAPFAGVMGLERWQLGDYVGANTAITRLVGRSGTLWVDFRLPQHNSGIELGTAVSVSAPGLLKGKLMANVIAKSPALDQAARNRGFRAELAGQSDELANLADGAIVDISVPVGEPRQVFKVPGTSVRRDNFGVFVFVISSNVEEGDEVFRAQRRSVTLAGEDNEFVYVLSGLNEGDVIAADGAFKLREGMRVALAADSKP